ncbi:transposase family protein [Bacillus wiedmannii]|uniref:transposase family protein n=1 Tax=Bacillus wiedmannii TaxID=1890302 RepID=UPI002E1B0A1D|nr:transposase family protein [Bacillus wiedmannii]
MREISWSAPDDFLALKDIYQMEDYLRLTIESTQRSHPCPTCHHRFSRPHSRYTRLIQDLPLSDPPVKLLLISRKWFCDSPTCPIKVFTERYDWLASNGRRTIRAEEVLRKLAFSTSCLAGEKVAQAMHLPATHDVLLAIIHKTNIEIEVSPFRRNR